jgi:hypothetical protein
MKTKQKWTWCLMSALALGLVAGCASDRNHDQTYNTGAPGPGITYEQGTDADTGQVPPGGWNNQGDGTWNGAPYEQQHPSPRPQMPQ